jgi:hypothetical protein
MFQDSKGGNVEWGRRQTGHEGWVKHDLKDKKKHKSTTFYAVSIPVFFSKASQYKKYIPLGCKRVTLKQNYTSYQQWPNCSNTSDKETVLIQVFISLDVQSYVFDMPSY